MREGDLTSDDVTLDGTLTRVVYRDAGTSFMVARFTSEGSAEAVTVVGELSGLAEGAPLRLHGQWVQDRKWGRQFRVASYQLRSPETLIGIEKFLGAGLLPGVGPEIARRMVAHFGMDTLEILSAQPGRLTEVAGIGAARAGRIAGAWQQHRHVQDVMVFLRGHGVSAAMAARIVKRYGKDAIAKVREDPYRLSVEVWGIGFATADAIADKLGIARDAPARIDAGLYHVLTTQLGAGHMFLPRGELEAAATELLGAPPGAATDGIQRLELSGMVTTEALGERGLCVGLTTARTTEMQVALLLADLLRTPARTLTIDVDAAVTTFESQTGLHLAAEQRRAVTAALLDKCVVVTGGPGVGKTTIVKAIVHLARLNHRRVALAAPTGRAAMRLSQATAAEAMTIHRLLEYQPQSGGFGRGREHPLDADVLIVDEASMIDIDLMHALLSAIRVGAQLVLVGDIDQLPSVGPGSVLSDLIRSGCATVVRLTEIFRQAASSQIVVNAHRINRGDLPELEVPSTTTTDFYFVGRDDPEAARSTIVDLVAERIPGRFGHSALADVQVLTPMHRGALGTAALNAALQERLNPASPQAAELQRGERIFRVGDKVMQIRNDYERGVFNGDIGGIASIDEENYTVVVDFGDERRSGYDRADLDQLTHAYAISVHKSQGSEYPAVVIPMVTQHYMMLHRSLLYTAVTRGKKLVVLVGQKKAIALAVRNASARRRNTWLAERLRSAVE